MTAVEGLQLQQGTQHGIARQQERTAQSLDAGLSAAGVEGLQGQQLRTGAIPIQCRMQYSLRHASVTGGVCTC
jgi:hypothetical protein